MRHYPLLLSLSLLTACGGGGGSASSPTPVAPTAAPLASHSHATPLPAGLVPRRAASLPQNPILVALGDSISYNWPPGEQSFPNIVGNYFGVPSLVLAYPGKKCSDVLVTQIPQIPANAAYITLDCGSNDNLWNSNTPYMPAPGIFAQVIAALRAKAPQALVVVITPGIWIDNIQGGPAWIEDEILQAHTTPLIPAIDASQFPVADFLDNIHFSAQGEQDVALAIEQSFLSY